MIHLFCPNCRSRLSARKELLGRTRRCPKCGKPVVIQPAETAPNESDAEPAVGEGPAVGASGGDAPAGTETTPSPSADIVAITQASLPLPDRLNRSHQYLICDRTKLLAVWKNDGHGWMVKTKTGTVSAARNPEQLPNQGDFRLVELRLDQSEDGLHLHGLRMYQLAQRWALTSLDRGDDAIVSKVIGPVGLNRDQKNAVRQALKAQFMPEVWTEAGEVLDFLANVDYHSTSVG